MSGSLIMLRIIMLGLSLSGSMLVAGPCLKPGQHLFQLFLLAADDPISLIQQSRMDLDQPHEISSAAAALCPLAIGLGEIFAHDLSVIPREEFERAVLAGKQHGLLDEALVLEAMIMTHQILKGESKDQAAILDLLQKAESRSALAQVLVQSLFYTSLEGKERARYELRLKERLDDPRQSAAIRGFIAGDFTQNLDYRKYPDEAVRAFRDLLRLTKTWNARYFKASCYFNLGIVHSYLNTDAGNRDGEKSLHAASELIKNLPNSRLHGALLVGRAQFLYRRHRHSEALQLLERSFHHFAEAYDREWMGDAYIKSATIHITQKNWQKALDTLQKARSFIPTAQTYDQNLVLQHEAEAYFGLRSYQKAYDTLKLYAEKFQKYNEDYARDTYEAAAARLGLQAEMEKTRLLRVQKDLATENLRLEALKTNSLRMQLGQRFGFAVLLVLLTGISLWISVKVVQSLVELRRMNHYLATQVLQRFMPPKLIQMVLRGTLHLHEKPEQRLVTALAVDIVSFTEATETLGTQEISRILNRFMVATTETIFAHNGLIERYVGDAVMIIFGDSDSAKSSEQALQALACAEAIRKRLDEINRTLPQDRGWRLRVRMGIHQGLAVVGNVGHAARMEYMALGEAVNLAHKLQEEAEPNEILISRSVTYHLPSGAYSLRSSYRNGPTAMELFHFHPQQTWRKSA